MSGNISIDGAGARMQLADQAFATGDDQIQVRSGARLLLRNLNLKHPSEAGAVDASAVAGAAQPESAPAFYGSVIFNAGALALEAVGISGSNSAAAAACFPRAA